MTRPSPETGGAVCLRSGHDRRDTTPPTTITIPPKKYRTVAV
jgi:hypothetical protein